MRRTWIPSVLWALVALLPVLGACDLEDEVREPDPGVMEAPAPEEVPSSRTVSMKGSIFVTALETDSLEIEAGEAVLWVNDDPIAHTVTSTEVPEGARSFDSGRMEEGDTWVRVFHEPGRYVYYCETHPSIMRGAVLIVR